jgi:putative dehydrogenase
VKIGVIGLGSMGMGTALNLCRAGHQVVGCEPRQPVWAELEAEGGHCVASSAELGACDAVIVFVVNAAQAEAVLFGGNGCMAAMPGVPANEP